MWMTFSGSFTASVAPSNASRGRLGARSALGACFACVVGLRAGTLAAPVVVRGRGAGARFGVVVALRVVVRRAVVEPRGAVRRAAARRRSLARCGRVLGSLLMMSGALVPAGFASACSDSDEGDDGDLTRSSPDEAVRVPLSWGGWSWSTLASTGRVQDRKCLRSLLLPD